MPISFWRATTSLTAAPAAPRSRLRRRPPPVRLKLSSTSSSGRGRLPAWLVRIRSLISLLRLDATRRPRGRRLSRAGRRSYAQAGRARSAAGRRRRAVALDPASTSGAISRAASAVLVVVLLLGLALGGHAGLVEVDLALDVAPPTSRAPRPSARPPARRRPRRGPSSRSRSGCGGRARRRRAARPRARRRTAPRRRGSRRRRAAARRSSGRSAISSSSSWMSDAVAAQQVLDARHVQPGLRGQAVAAVPQRVVAVGADQRRDVGDRLGHQRVEHADGGVDGVLAPSPGRSCTCRRRPRPAPAPGTATECSRLS